MADESIDSFLAGLKGRLQQTVHDTTVNPSVQSVEDSQLEYFTTPAPNAIEWLVKPEYMNIPSVFHHVRQYQMIRDFFQLRCPLPSCNKQDPEFADCWEKSQQYLESENLLTYVKKYDEDACPCCHTTRSEFIEDELLKQYNQLHLVVGMRGGKSSTAAMVGTYMEHRILNVGHGALASGGLARYFDQLPRQPFEITFTAATDVQAADTVWAKYVSLRQSSPWFDQYIRWIKQLELKQATANGAKPWAYEERNKDIINGLLNVKINSMNSSSSGMAGRTRIVSIIDELARFDSKDSPRSADEAYRVLENSLRTLRGQVSKLKLKNLPWLGAMISISSPISDEDKSMRLLRQAPSIKGMYYGHYATWDFNPDQPRSEFDDDFEKDPIGAARDFGARPPTAASPYIPDPARFRSLAIQADLKPTASFKKVIHVDRTGREYVSATPENALLLRNGERHICFPPDTRLQVGHSMIQIKDVKAGDRVVTHKGRERQVVQTMSSDFTGDLCEIKLHKIHGDGIECTPNHPVAVFSETGLTWKRADEITKSDYVCISIDKSIVVKDKINLIEYVDLPALRKRVHDHGGTRVDCIPDSLSVDDDLMRLFGYYLAEGSITRVMNYIIFSFHEKETDYIKDVANIVKNKFGIGVSYIRPGPHCVQVVINSLIISSLIDALFGHGSRGKFIPQWAMTLPHSLQKSLLVGLYRGDGTCLDRDGGKIMVTLGLVNEQVTQAAWQLLLRLGIDASFSKTKTPKLGKSEVWLCRYCTDHIGLTAQIWPGNMRNTQDGRMSYHVKRHNGLIYYKVSSIARIPYTGKVYNIEVADDHSYTVGHNYTVHNCFDAGLSFDSFAAACAHGEWVQSPDGKHLVTVYDWVFRLVPDKQPKRDIWFDFVIQAVDYLKLYYLIGHVTFDRWQSSHLIQQIRDRGIHCSVKSTTPEMFLKFLNDVTYSKIRMLPPMPDDATLEPPNMSAQGLAFYELEHLERSADMKKIYNPRKGVRRGYDSDDVATVVVAANASVQAAVNDTSISNSTESRLRREQLGGYQWESGGRLFRPISNKRGW